MWRRWWWVGLLVLVASRAYPTACDHKYPDDCRQLFRGGINLPTNVSLCTEFTKPSPAPPLGQQYFYCKAGVGWCTEDGNGAEFCPGGGGGSTSFSAITTGINNLATMTINAGAQLISNTPNGITTTGTGTISGLLFDSGGSQMNAKAPPFNAVGDGVADDTAAINACLAAACPTAFATTNAGTCYLPGGRYLTSGPILPPQGAVNSLNVGCTLAGAGKGVTMIISNTVGTGYSMIRSGGIVRTCTGSAGSCDARFGRSGRGAGCYCQSNSDCSSNVCATTSGAVERATTIKNLSLLMAKDNMVGLDAAFMSESLFSNLSIATKDGVSHTNTVGVVFSDGNGAVSGYSNTLMASTITQADVCVWLRSTANAELILGNSIKQGNTAGCGSGVVIEATTDASVIGNLLQATATPVCAGGTTCSGGYNHGRNCAVSSDCNEADVLVLGNADRIAFNHIEDSANPHVVLGCAAQLGGPCPSGVIALGPIIIGNEDAGSGTPVLRTNVSAVNSPLILENSAATMNQIGPNIFKFDRQAEPLPTCVNGSTGTSASVLFDTTLTTPTLCECTEASKWCVVQNAACTTGTATTCGADGLAASSLTGQVAVVNGGTGLASTALNDVLVGTAANVFSNELLPSCSTASSILQYNNSSQQFPCATTYPATSLTGQVPIANGGTGQATALAGFNALSPLTTKGDLLTFDGTNNVRLATAANGLCLVTDSTTTTGNKWGSCSAAGGGTVTSIACGIGLTCSPGSPITTSGTITPTLEPLLNPQVTCADCANNSPDRGAIITGQGSAPVLWTKRTPTITNTVPFWNGTDTVFGTLPDATLTDGYSGTGTCVGSGFVRTLTRDTAPTCSAVNLNAGSTDISGVLSHTNGGTDVNSAPVNDVLVGNGTNWQRNVVPISQAPLHYQALPSGFVSVHNVIWASDFIACNSSADATTGWATLMSTVNGNPDFGTDTVYLPSGCKPVFKSPGNNGTAARVNANVNIFCDDQSAGFAVDTQTCHSGQYFGAACNTNAECTQVGGAAGTSGCTDAFGTAAVNPCSSATCFVPTSGWTTTLLGDTGTGSNDIQITNCSFFVSQANPYQLCSGAGAHGGDPCRQECDSASTTPGLRCEVNTDCPSGTCLRTSDCHIDGAGATCAGISATKTPAGHILGNIRALDLSNTTRTNLVNINVFDSFQADSTVKVGPHSTVYNSNLAREGTDCTSPIPGTPSNSVCFGAGTTAGTCCYGAALGATFTLNTQPATAVTNGLSVGFDTQITRVVSRGSTSAINIASQSRIDECTAWPPATTGPGTAGNGFLASDTSQVAKSYALFLKSGGTCVNMTGAHSGVIGVKCAGGPILNGIILAGADSHAMGNNIRNLDAASAIGIALNGNNDSATSNYVEGISGTGVGIDLNSFGTQATTNVVQSTGFNDTLGVGIQVDTCTQCQVVSNTISRVLTAGIKLNAGGGTRISSNAIGLGGVITPSLIPIHILDAGTGVQQTTIDGNYFTGGWRGFACSVAQPLTNTNLSGNRFFSLGGAPTSCGGPGVGFIGNYVNGSGAAGSMSCDASCAGGAPITRGAYCSQDSDCTAGGNTCNASAQKCIPEPLAGFINNPQVTQGAIHNLWFGNTLFAGKVAVKQCGGTAPTSPGAFCNTTAVTGCTAPATCTGGSEPFKTCVGTGIDSGLFCCTGGGAQTCAVRTNTPMIRIAETGTAISPADIAFTNNLFFGSNGAGNMNNLNMIDMVSSASLGTITGLSWTIANNTFDGGPGGTPCTSCAAIVLPTTNPAQFTGLAISGNNFQHWPTPATTGNIKNYLGEMGSISLLNGRMVNGTIHTLPGAAGGPNFFPLDSIPAGATDPPVARTLQVSVATGSETVWKATCSCTNIVGTGASTRTFTIEKGTGNPGPLPLTFAGTTQSCQMAAGASTCTTNAVAPASFVDGNEHDWTVVNVLGTTLNAEDCSCVSYVSHDTAM